MNYRTVKLGGVDGLNDIFVKITQNAAVKRVKVQLKVYFIPYHHGMLLPNRG